MNYKIMILSFLTLKTVISGKIARIIGGEVADIHDFPYMVSLRFEDTNDLRCGGAIISRRHVLTAAHCLYRCTCDDIVVYAGTRSSVSTSGPRYELRRFVTHPDYDMISDAMQSNDIAVLTIKGLFVFSPVLNKVKLPTGDVSGGERVVLAGWGKEIYNSRFTSDRLRKATMTVLEYELCSPDLGGIVTENQICVLEGTGIGACTGDSGGPLIFNGEVVGIASFVVPCATGAPDIYTRVTSFLGFIRSEMRGNLHTQDFCVCQ